MAMAKPLRLGRQLWIRINPELLAKLDAWCAGAGMKRSDAMRLAIEKLIKSKA